MELYLAITGLPGSGKSTVGDYLAQRWGFGVYEGSAILKQRAAQRGRVLSGRADYEREYRFQQEITGNLAIVADTIIAQAAGEQRVCQSGLRSGEDARRIRRLGYEQHVGVLVVALTCPVDICLQRIDTTNPKNPSTPEEYAAHVRLNESTDQFGCHLGKVLRRADVTLDTSKPFAETCHEVDELVMAMEKLRGVNY